MIDIVNILKNVKKINIKYNLIKYNFQSNQNNIVENFKGYDEYSGITNYNEGDSIKNIVWRKCISYENVYVKKIVSTKDSKLVILLDISKSMLYASHKINLELALEIIGMIYVSYSRLNNNLIIVLYTDKIEGTISCSNKRLFEIYQYILDHNYNSKSNVTNISNIIFKVLSWYYKSNILVISDFLDKSIRNISNIYKSNRKINFLRILNNISNDKFNYGLCLYCDLESKIHYITKNNKFNNNNYFKNEKVIDIDDSNYIQKIIFLFKNNFL